jgi:hypothetical protein
MQSFLEDLTGSRMMRKQPALRSFAILSLALDIRTNTDTSVPSRATKVDALVALRHECPENLAITR